MLLKYMFILDIAVSLSFTIYEMYLSDELPDMTVIGEPMVDELGQVDQKDWRQRSPLNREGILSIPV